MRRGLDYSEVLLICSFTSSPTDAFLKPSDLNVSLKADRERWRVEHSPRVPGRPTCGDRGELQTQHLRVVSLDLHQLVQELQPEDPEHRDGNESADLVRIRQANRARSGLTAGFRSGLRPPGAVRPG